MEKIKLNSKILVVVSVLAILFGSWLIFSSSARKTEKSLNIAKELVIIGDKELEQFKTDFQDPLSWYKPEYTSPIVIVLSSCQEKATQASSEIEAAKKAGRSKEKRTHADEAIVLIKTISGDLSKAKAQLEVFEKTTATARQALVKVKELGLTVTSLNDQVKKRLADEGAKYLSKYVSLNTEKSNQAQNNLAEIASLYQKASNLLPVENWREHLGDPNGAIELLKAAEQNLNSSRLAAEEVIKNFDFYREATDKADSSIDSAKQKIKEAANYLDSLVVNGPLKPDLALKPSFEDLAQASLVLSAATTALETLTDENKYDLPLAYSNALKASDLISSSLIRADHQVSLFAEATKFVKQLRTAIADLEKSINGSRPYRDKLNNHTPTTWSNVVGNIKQASENCNLAKTHLVIAEKLISIHQSYQSALMEINDGLKLLKQSEDLISTLIQAAEDLESYRANWPQVKNQAESAIGSEESNINSYGSYDSSAQSDFDSAKNFLSLANSLANNREYESAVSKAQEAIRLANGTGDRAYQAYRAHEVAEEAASSFSNSFSSDSSSSSSSDYSSSSSSYSNDSSSYSSSSSSSDGGGWSNSSSSSSDGGGWE